MDSFILLEDAQQPTLMAGFRSHWTWEEVHAYARQRKSFLYFRTESTKGKEHHFWFEGTPTSDPDEERLETMTIRSSEGEKTSITRFKVKIHKGVYGKLRGGTWYGCKTASGRKLAWQALEYSWALARTAGDQIRPPDLGGTVPDSLPAPYRGDEPARPLTNLIRNMGSKTADPQPSSTANQTQPAPEEVGDQSIPDTEFVDTSAEGDEDVLDVGSNIEEMDGLYYLADLFTQEDPLQVNDQGTGDRMVIPETPPQGTDTNEQEPINDAPGVTQTTAIAQGGEGTEVNHGPNEQRPTGQPNPTTDEPIAGPSGYAREMVIPTHPNLPADPRAAVVATGNPFDRPTPRLTLTTPDQVTHTIRGNEEEAQVDGEPESFLTRALGKLLAAPPAADAGHRISRTAKLQALGDRCRASIATNQERLKKGIPTFPLIPRDIQVPGLHLMDPRAAIELDQVCRQATAAFNETIIKHQHGILERIGQQLRETCTGWEPTKDEELEIGRLHHQFTSDLRPTGEVASDKPPEPFVWFRPVNQSGKPGIYPNKALRQVYAKGGKVGKGGKRTPAKKQNQPDDGLVRNEQRGRKRSRSRSPNPKPTPSNEGKTSDRGKSKGKKLKQPRTEPPGQGGRGAKPPPTKAASSEQEGGPPLNQRRGDKPHRTRGSRGKGRGRQGPKPGN